MTDLPELQHLLIEAAGRRSRRRRRVGGARAVALVAAAAVAVIAVPRGGSDDIEIPAVTPTPAPTVQAAPLSIKSAYAAFRRQASASDDVMLFGRLRGADTRLVASTKETRVFLAVKGKEACVVVTPIDRPAAGQYCVATRLALTGDVFVGSLGGPSTPSGIVFPDGVDAVTLTLADGSRRPYVVTGNGVAIDPLGSQIERADWVDPAGHPHNAVLKPGSSELYSLLRAPADPADELPGFPGSRPLLRANSVEAWLVPRRAAVCLVVRIRGRQASGCHSVPKPNVRPLVVAMPGGVSGRVVVAAFIDAISEFRVSPQAGIGQAGQTAGVLTFSDGGEARTVRFKDTAGDTLHQAIPAGDRSFVLGGVAKDPKSFPDP